MPQLAGVHGQPVDHRQALASTCAGGGELALQLRADDRARQWLTDALSVALPDTAAEWSPEEVYLSLPRPGGDAWLRIERETGSVEYERTDRGWVSYLNDLHKGRHTGLAWKWFLDIFSVACLVFCITGLFILKFHAANRPTTWPMVGMGLVAPLLLVILFVH